MFNEETKKELVKIIAQGVAEGLADLMVKDTNSAVRKPYDKVATKVTGPDVVEEDDFAEDEVTQTTEELAAEKKAKAAATRKKNAAAKKAKLAEEKAAEAEEVVEEVVEEDDELNDDLDDDGTDAEMIEAPAMERPDFMNTLKRYASKHPNGEQEGRKLASAVLKREFDVEKFGELEDQYFEAMCDALKTEIKGI